MCLCLCPLWQQLLMLVSDYAGKCSRYRAQQSILQNSVEQIASIMWTRLTRVAQVACASVLCLWGLGARNPSMDRRPRRIPDLCDEVPLDRRQRLPDAQMSSRQHHARTGRRWLLCYLTINTLCVVPARFRRTQPSYLTRTGDIALRIS